MLLYFVRHGESEFNAQGRVQGQLDPSLSELGRRQAMALVEGLAGTPIEAVFASPLARAMASAAPLCAARGLAPRTDARLMEINAGVFQGLTWDEIQSRYPTEAVRWRSADPDWIVPQGESRRALAARGVAALEAIRETPFRQVAVIAHGGVLTAALKAMLGIPPERKAFSLFNGSISQVAWDKQPTLVTLNQIEHLVRHDAHRGRAGDLY